MSEHDYNQILNELKDVKKGLRDLEVAVGKIETEVRHELELHKHDAENVFNDHDKRISDTEKWKSWVALTVFGAILIGLLKMLGI